MLITFLHIKGTVQFEFIPQGKTVNQAYYVEILRRLRWAVPKKGPELWPNGWILLHDNPPAHKGALSDKLFVPWKSITEAKNQSYSLYLTPNDLWLFP
jgi:hypothetical protein